MKPRTALTKSRVRLARWSYASGTGTHSKRVTSPKSSGSCLTTRKPEPADSRFGKNSKKKRWAILRWPKTGGI
eukprot:1545448-Pleurochrysis_carterae.AAC.1